ncbi:TylF/MycF/NovP-related O-methyltransferase [Azonexus sp. R2A61]|uniref:TylF/MycF/NovP-related O-methyltransferase n=1 Tax=Azonexus sp. R2A61 TaxID=2744443 RepID=UPI001F424B72|nr:TylF/MycF/NovP-related O-methyltransferase [Azonexus sp. R2A61]
MNKWLKKRLTKFSYDFLRSQAPWHHRQAPEIVHTHVLPYASYSPWSNDPAFQAAYEQVKTHTLVDAFRLYELWTLARQLEDVRGDFLEVGVWRGGSGCLLALIGKTQNRRTFLADTFSGVVKTGARDTSYVGGEHADTGEDVVHDLMKRCDVQDHAEILKGIFPETNAEKIERRKLALVHIDVDAYESAKDVLNWTLHRLQRGGVVVFDDYGFFGCEGVTRLVNEFIAHNSDFRFVHNLNGHAILIKLKDSDERAAI